MPLCFSIKWLIENITKLKIFSRCEHNKMCIVDHFYFFFFSWNYLLTHPWVNIFSKLQPILFQFPFFLKKYCFLKCLNCLIIVWQKSPLHSVPRSLILFCLFRSESRACSDELRSRFSFHVWSISIFIRLWVVLLPT